MKGAATRCGSFLRINYCVFEEKYVTLHHSNNTNIQYDAV